MAASGERLRAALPGGDGGAAQPGMQALVDAIIVLGYLPSQSRSSSTEEKRLVVRLIKARKAGTLTCQQNAQLANLKPATRAVGQNSEELPLAAPGRIMDASGGAAGSGCDRQRAASASGDGGGSQPGMQELVDAIIALGHLPEQSKSSSTEEKQLAGRLMRARKAGTLTWQQDKLAVVITLGKTKKRKDREESVPRPRSPSSPGPDFGERPMTPDLR